jgi:hypothetical protein
MDSIWHRKQGPFRQFLGDIVDQSTIVPDALGDFRELKVLPKEFSQMTLQELLSSPKLIERLYSALRKMPPDKSYKLPYTKEDRQRELIELLAQEYNIDLRHTHPRIVTGHYDDGSIAFNYALEVVLAAFKDRDDTMAGRVEFLGYINSDTAVDFGGEYFEGGYFSWQDKKGNPLDASSVREILRECGFNTSVAMSKRRFHSLIYLNLLTPIPDWIAGAGKTHITLRPYEKLIAKTVSTLAYKIPSYHGHGYRATIEYSTRDDSQIAKLYLENFLKKRKAAIDANPQLKIIDRITQSGVWYRVRPDMINGGFEPPESWTLTRRTLQGSIQKVIDELWPDLHLTREDLGIVAASKGAVFYDGEQWPINGDSIDALAEKGVAIIVIEKEGVADALAPFARKYGIALAHTGGRFTNAIKKLIERAKKAGSVVRILTDYDAVGMDIAAATITTTIRIGIERDIIKWLQKNGFPGITEGEVEEEYTPSGTTIEITDPYLLTKRIELDSIQRVVGWEKLWEYIMYRLHLPKFNAVFDLTKVIEMPTTESLYPEPMKEVLRRVGDYLAKITESKEEQILTESKNVKELPEISKKNTEIEEELVGEVTEASHDDDGMKKIIALFEEMQKPGVLPDPDGYNQKRPI